jgi:predicted RNase H-like nuclease (RuvC/YqgF family)
LYEKRQIIVAEFAEDRTDVNEKLETAINIGCSMVSRSKEVRKKLKTSAEDKTALKKSLKELDRMSVELIDRLFEINARIDLAATANAQTIPGKNKFLLWLERRLNKFRKRAEAMRLTYQDIYTL